MRNVKRWILRNCGTASPRRIKFLDVFPRRQFVRFLKRRLEFLQGQRRTFFLGFLHVPANRAIVKVERIFHRTV